MLKNLMTRLAALRYVFRRAQIDDEIKQELDSHVERLAERYIALGMPADEARRAARLRVGNTLRVREDIYSLNTFAWLDWTGAQIRHAARMFTRQPLYTAAIVLTVAVGIASSTMVFSIVDAVLLKPLPFPHASELVALWQSSTDGRNTGGGMSPANASDWKREARSFSNVGLWTPDVFIAGRPGEGERVAGGLVSGDFFATLGVPPAMGRTFTTADEAAPDQVVLSYRVWTRLFGADGQLVGRDVVLNGKPFKVAGVLPPDFVFPPITLGEAVIQPELYVPLETRSPMMRDRGAPFMMAIARLAPGVSVASAQLEATTIARRLEASFPRVNVGRGAVVTPLHEQVVGNVRRPLLLLLSAAAILLLISCLNVAGMLVARALARTSEVSVRVALGVTRARLLGQFVVESLILCVAGGIVGLGIAYAFQRILVAVNPTMLPRLADVSLDARVLAFAFGVSLVTATVFAALPLMHACVPDIVALLGQTQRGLAGSKRAHRLRSSLVAGQVAIAMLLLVGVGLLAKTLLRLNHVELGFEPASATTFEVSIPGTKYQRGEGPAVLARLIERLQRLPDVAVVGAMNVLPLATTAFTWSFHIENRPDPEGTPPARADYRAVTPGIFAAMQMPLMRGRLISDRDTRDSPPVAVINEAMARRFWPNEDPVGRRLRIDGPPTPSFGWATIVGVVGDIRGASVDAPAAPALYRPVAQHPFMDMAVVVRMQPGAAAPVSALRAEGRGLDPDLMLHSFKPLDAFVAQSTALRRSILLIVSLFAGVALFLVAVGIHGLVTTIVSQRFAEMGIRMAMGATDREIVWTIMKHSVTLVGAGLLVGVVAALAVMPATTALLFEVRPTDAVAYVGAALLLATLSLLATYLPARAVSRLDPARALRSS
jgi:putative ABC transport system permease protein